MGTETPAEGGDNKTAIKNEGGAAAGNQRRGNQNQFNRRFVKKEKFLGADPDLQGFVFESAGNRAQQITNFTTVDTRIKALIGQNCDPFVLESIEKMEETLPKEPEMPAVTDETKRKMEEMKFKSKFDRWLTRTEKIEKELKQVYSKYFGQCDEDMKSTLAEDVKFDTANKEKDVISLRKILQSVNFSYRSSEEPIKTMWQAKVDFIKLRQQKHQSVQEYYEKFMALKEVNDTLNINVYDDPGLVDIIARIKRKDGDNLNDDQRNLFLEIGRERMMGMHLLMGSDRNRFGGAIEEFEHAYLMDKRNNYPKTLHDSYTLLKGWKKGINKQNYPNKVGVSFNTVGDDDGTALATDGERYSGPACKRCGRPNHPTEKCFANRHANGNLLHIEGAVEEEWEEFDDEVSHTNPVINY